MEGDQSSLTEYKGGTIENCLPMRGKGGGRVVSRGIINDRSLIKWLMLSFT